MRNFRLTNRLITGFVLGILVLASPAWGQPVTVQILISHSLPVYDAIIASLTDQIITAGFVLDADVNFHTNNITEDAVKLPDFWQQKPTLLVAVGTDAAKMARQRSENIPIVFTMVYDLDKNDISSTEEDRLPMTGVLSDISLKTYLEYTQKILPAAKRIGVFYDPVVSEELVAELVQESRDYQFDVVGAAIADTREVPQALIDMGDRIDIFWILPDRIYNNKNARQQIMMYWLKKNTPIIGIAPNYVKAGALFCLAVDYDDLGRQTGDMCVRVLQGTPPEKIPTEVPRKPVLTYNVHTADQLSVTIPPLLLKDAKAIDY